MLEKIWVEDIVLCVCVLSRGVWVVIFFLKKKLDYRYIILGKFGISDFILGFWVYKIYDI